MDYKITPHASPRAYLDLSKEWIQAVRRSESGTWIFPPLAGVDYLIQQFIEDKPRIGMELFGDGDALCIIDCNLCETHYTKDSLYEEIQQAITEQVRPAWLSGAHSLGVLLKVLGTGRTKVVLFVRGLDTAVRAGNMEALTLLSQLASNNRFVSVILLMCTDITDPQFALPFSKHAALIQNISVVPRKSREEGGSFLEYLERGWDVQLSADQTRWIDDNLDASLRFTKEVFRQAQKNPDLTYDALYTLPSLEYKARALLDNFLEDQREVILRTVFHEEMGPELRHALKYLKTIRWIYEENGNLRLSMRFIDHYIRHNEQPHDVRSSVVLTVKEEAAFRLLQAHRGTVVSRETLADAIWGEDAAEKYSDWAIDQLIHRLKAKVAAGNRTVSIRAVRGQGFMLRDEV